MIQNILFYPSILALSQFTRTSVYASRQRRALVADTLSDQGKCSVSVVLLTIVHMRMSI